MRRRRVLLYVAIAAVGVLQIPSVLDLVSVWHGDSAYSHGFIIPLIALGIIWYQREGLRQIESEPSAQGWLVVLFSLLLLVLAFEVESPEGERTAIFIRGLALITALAGGVLLMWGAERLRWLAFPLCYLLFMLPLPEPLFDAATLALRRHAASVATAACHLAQVPVAREDELVHLMSTTVEVNETCSGIRSQLALLPIAVAISYVVFPRWPQRLFIVATAVPIAMATNAIRVASVVLLTHFYGQEVGFAWHDFHASKILFTVAFVVLCTEVYLLHAITVPREHADTDAESSESAYSKLPLTMVEHERVNVPTG